MNKILSLIIPAIFIICAGCSQDDILQWDPEGYAYAHFSSSDPCIYSFAGRAPEFESDVVSLPITVVGAPVSHARQIQVNVLKDKLDANSRYEFPSIITVREGETEASLTVKIYRTPNLAVKADTIVFGITDSESIKAGVPDLCSKTVILTDRFVKPEWWGDEYDEYYNPVGVCNDLKLRLWFEIFGNFDDPKQGGRSWTGSKAVMSLYLANQTALERYGKYFYELQEGDTPLI